MTNLLLILETMKLLEVDFNEATKIVMEAAQRH